MYAIYSQPMEVELFHSLLELHDRTESGGRGECSGCHYSRRGRQISIEVLFRYGNQSSPPILNSPFDGISPPARFTRLKMFCAPLCISSMKWTLSA